MYVRVQIYQKTTSVLEYIRKLYGGRIYQRPGFNGHGLWIQRVSEVQKLLEDTLPWLRVKEEQAVIALIIAKCKQKYKGTQLPVELRNRCILLGAKLSSLQSYTKEN